MNLGLGSINLLPTDNILGLYAVGISSAGSFKLVCASHNVFSKCVYQPKPLDVDFLEKTEHLL